MLRSLAAAALVALAAPALSAPASAQTQEVLFPGQSGAELRASVRAAYRPSSLRGDNDDLYARIDSVRVDGTLGVIGVYSGLFVPFDGNPNSDPSQDVFNGGSGINQEHTFPRARLAGSSSHPSEDDLHNLFPTRVRVNGDRGNLPFAEIPDAQTTRWYRGTAATAADPPLAERDEWSELRSGQAFEPREAHEGNAARAMFYVATVWDGAADQAWFDAQKEDLLDWHRADPVDQADVDRSARVAAFQSGCAAGACVNPFVVDSTLIRRAFFPEIDVAGEPAPEATRVRAVIEGPNPFRGGTALRVWAPGAVRVTVVDVLGREVARPFSGPVPASGARVELTGAGLAPGVYVVRVASGAEASGAALTLRLVRAR